MSGFDLEDRPAIVTGAAGGIGRATAIMLAASGALVTCADRDGVGAQGTADAITAAGGHATGVAVDVSIRGEVEELVASVPGLAVMCNIAGIITNATVLDLTDEDLRRVLDINFFGMFYGAQAAGRAMVAAGRGSIVNMLSSAVDTPAPTIGAYAISKAAGRQLTMTMATELRPTGVRVNAVAPGFIVTGLTARHYTRPDGSIDEGAKESYLAAMSQSVPIGDVDDVAYAVLYLASDASTFTTGQVLRPNGGVAMPG